MDATGRRSALRWAVIPVLCLLSSGCAVVSHTTYFEPRTEMDHELRSPYSGNPTQSFSWFGSPSNVLTVNGDGFRVGTLTWNSAMGFTWMGPLLPIFPIPLRGRIETGRIRVWVAMVAEEDMGVRLDRFRLRVPETALEIPPEGFWNYTDDPPDSTALAVVHSLAAGERRAWSLEFSIPEGVNLDRYDLVIDGLSVGRGPTPPITVTFRLVRGWRFTSLP